MSKKSTLKRLMERDGARCGIHAGGCGGVIAKSDNHNIDHIFPQTYTRTLPNRGVFRKSWNKQPMHSVCNTKRGGPNVGGIVFGCTCHHVYIDETHNLHVSYRDPYSEAWTSVKYLTWGAPAIQSPEMGQIPYDVTHNKVWTRPGEAGSRFTTQGRDDRVRPTSFTRDKPIDLEFHDGKRRIASFKLVPGSMYERIGFSAGSRNGRRFGHLFKRLGIFQRIIFNVREAFRCFRWDEVASRHQEFLNVCGVLGVGALVEEVGDEFFAVIAQYHMQRITLEFIRRYGVAEGRVKMVNSILNGVEWVVESEISYMRLWDSNAKAAIQRSLLIDLMGYARYLLESKCVVMNNEEEHEEILEAISNWISQRRMSGA